MSSPERHSVQQYLLDTHTYLWWLTDDQRLSQTAKAVITNPNNLIYISVISAWEVSLKQSLLKNFSVNVSLGEIFSDASFKILPIEIGHVLTLNKLPFHHKDPFDRMLIAQALTQNLPIITIDEKFNQYQDLSLLW
jgi:PIN domain nuclease of toxin-antitoxin system